MRTLTGGAIGLAACFVLLAGPAAQAQSTRIAFVDGQRIFGSVPGRAEAEAQFNKEMDSVRAREKVMSDSMAALIADYSKSEATLSAADKTTRQQSIRDKQAAFQQQQQQLEAKAQERQNELVRPILDRIHRVIDDLRSENGYTLIVDVSPNAGGAVVSFDKNLDVTDQVIRKLQSMPVATGGGASSGGSPKPAAGARPTPSGVTQPKSPPTN